MNADRSPVTECCGCPFHDGQYDECRMAGNRSCSEERRDDDPVPPWCPLIDADVLVHLVRK